MPYIPMRTRQSYRKAKTKKTRAKTIKSSSITPSVAKKIVDLGSEQKRFVQTFSGDISHSAVANAVKYKHMTLIPQGDESYERIGDEIRVNHIGIDLAFRTFTNVTSDKYAIRVLLIRLNAYDNLDFTAFNNFYKNEINVPLSPIYTGAASEGGYVGLTQRPNDMIYKVLLDRTYTFDNEVSNNGGGVKHIKINKKLKKTIKFHASSNTVREPIYLFLHTMNLDGHSDANVIKFGGYITTSYKD